MEVLKLPKNPYNIQKCLFPSCQFLKENYGRICLVNCNTDLQYIVKIGMCESKIVNNLLYIDDSVIVSSSSQYLIKSRHINRISVDNFKVLNKPHAAKMVQIEVIFCDVFEMVKYKKDQMTLAKIIKDILKFYTFCNKSTVFLDTLEINKNSFMKCLVISCGDNLKNDQPYEINSGTQIKIQNCISELEVVNSQIDYSQSVGGYHKISRILEDIIKFASVNSYKRKLINKLLLIGPQGCGKSSLVRQVSSKSKSILLEVKACEIISLESDKMESELQDVFKKAQIYATLHDCCIILINNIDIISLGRNAYCKKFVQTLSALLEDIKEKNKIVVIATANSSEEIDPQLKKTGSFEDELEMSYPTAGEREEITELILRKYKICPDKTLLAHISKCTTGFSGSDLNLLVIEALKLYYKKQGFQRPLDCHALLDCFKRVLKKVIPEVLKEAVNMNGENDLKFSSIGGLEKVKSILDLAVIKQLQNFEKFHRLGISFTNGILLYGPPGCAKTSLVKALAKECNIALFVTSAADLYSPYVGDTEKKLIKLFSMARMSSPSIIFIDEIDSVIGSKSKEREQGVQERILSTLLLEMDGVSSKVVTRDKHPLNFLEENKGANEGDDDQAPKEVNFGVIVLGATNRPHLLDDALMRPGRFDRLVYVPPPDEAERLQILKKLTENMPLHESVDMETLAQLTEFYTGADLKNLCQESGLYAMESVGMDVESVHQFHFEQIIFGLKPSLNAKIIEYYKSFEQNGVPY